jgi:HEAT repeat protein
MPLLERVLPWAAISAATAWVLLSAGVLLGRALYETRGRWIRAAHRELDRPEFQALPPAERARRVESLLERLPRSVVVRMAADSSSPPWLAEVFSHFALEKWGLRRLARDAARHHGGLGRWRRIAALRILAQAQHPDTLGLLARALRCGDAQVVGAAVVLLGRQAEREAAERLLVALEERLFSPSRIATSLEAFPLDISELLLFRLGHHDPVVRFWAATLLERFPKAPGLDGRLAARAVDPDPAVRKAVVETLGRVGGPRAAVAALTLIEDPVWYVRAHAARAIGDLRRVDLAPRVAPLLADPEWWVRLAAKQAFEAMGTGARPVLERYLDHPDRFARNGAAEVLQNVGVLDEIARAILRGEHRPSDVALLRKAVQAGGRPLIEGLVGRMGPGASAVREALAVPELLEVS